MMVDFLDQKLCLIVKHGIRKTITVVFLDLYTCDATILGKKLNIKAKFISGDIAAKSLNCRFLAFNKPRNASV